MFVKPVPGRTIRWPRTYRPLAEAGEHVPCEQYWLRAVNQGDLELAEAPADETRQSEDAAK